MPSLLVYYDGLILLNAMLLSISLIIIIPTAFHTDAPPGVEIIQFIYSFAVMVMSYGLIIYQAFLTGDPNVKRAKMVYAIERVLAAEILACLLNSIAVTYRASFLSYQAPSVIAFVLSWLATVFSAVGRYMFPRHPSLKFEAAKRFVVDDEPLEVDPESRPADDLEMRKIERPLPALPKMPEAVHSRFSL